MVDLILAMVSAESIIHRHLAPQMPGHSDLDAKKRRVERGVHDLQLTAQVLLALLLVQVAPGKLLLSLDGTFLGRTDAHEDACPHLGARPVPPELHMLGGSGQARLFRSVRAPGPDPPCLPNHRRQHWSMDPFLLPSSLNVVDVQDTPDRLIVTVQDTREYVCCPSCGQPSRRIHSHYLRVTQDTAVGDRAVEVHLHVRRLRCDTASCSHLTFAETWPTWLNARVQRTSRLAQVQRSVAMALGGEAGKRLLTLLHEGTSGDTLLRLIRAQDVPEHPPPRMLGVDDFRFRRGKTYGTILIDLERHRVVDVLPDRLAATLATWLPAHPGTLIISRDRYGDYARGAATGAPDAQQIADRFHLLKNLRDVAELWLKRHRAGLVEPSSAVIIPSEPPAVAVSPPVQRRITVPMNATVRRLTAVLEARAARLARYERATALHAQGYSVRAVAGLTGIGRTTIAHWIKAGRFPGRASVLAGVAPYADLVCERVLQQEWTGQQIVQEVVALGYTGSANGVYELLRWLRLGRLLPSIEDQQGQRTVSAVPALTRYSAKQGAWIFIQAPDRLKARD